MNVVEKQKLAPVATGGVSERRKRVSRALSLFHKSPLKQKKWQMLSRYLDKDMSGKVCLDIGSDNGVISYLLRERLGGTWYSTDLIPETVCCIRDLVGERVLPMDGPSLPFPAELFDVVVVVDMFEHLEDDQTFAAELARVLKPGGILVTNVPDPREGAWRFCKRLIGQSDAAHGHVRPGYPDESLAKLLGTHFVFEEGESYSRIFSDLVDTMITAGLDILKGGRGKKGTVVTNDDVGKFEKTFRMYSMVAPVFRFCADLDNRFPNLHGNMRIARFKYTEK